MKVPNETSEQSMTFFSVEQLIKTQNNSDRSARENLSKVFRGTVA